MIGSASPLRSRLERSARRLPWARPAVRRLRRLARPAWFGTLRRTAPMSDYFGRDRGRPIDRSYIDGFIAEHRGDIRGHVLEVKDRRYTEQFGCNVERSDVLDIDPTNAAATIVADLAAADAIPAESFDCFVLTQTLMYVYDLRAALRHAHRLLRPGGVLLVTASAVSRIDPDAVTRDYWRFTANSCAALFVETFGAERVTVRSYGNVLACVASLMGLACEDLSERELAVNDPAFPLTIAVRAVKG